MQDKTRIQVLVERKIKSKAQKIMKEKGFTISEVIRLFLSEIANEELNLSFVRPYKKKREIEFAGYHLDLPDTIKRDDYYS